MEVLAAASTATIEEEQGTSEGDGRIRLVEHPDSHIMKRLYIRKQDLLSFGYSNNCSACEFVRQGVDRAGVNHSENCRERIMHELSKSSEGRDRLREQKHREDLYLASLLEKKDITLASSKKRSADSISN